MNLLKQLTYDIWRRTLPKYIAREPGCIGLECGTGPGHLIGLLQQWFPELQLFGLDIDLPALRSARKASPHSFFLLASAESLPFPDQTFEMIISLHVVEHLKEPECFIQEADRVLRRGGILIFATPNPAGIAARLMGKRWSGWTSEHISLYPPPIWRDILTNHGFMILRHGTTGLSGIPAFRKFPLALLNGGLLFLFGFFPWRYGEAYMCICKKAN